MDLNNYWQENKRFVVTVASGVIVFVVGAMLVERFFGSELARQARAAETTQRKLTSEAMYNANDLEAAEADNEALKRSFETLAQATAFAPRPLYALDPARGSASNQYFAAVATTRDELLRVAGRGNLRLPEDLGLPALSPTRDLEIGRYLAALDLVDRAVRMALAAGCQRIDKIAIKLDPKLASKSGVGLVERTRVEMVLSGKAGPLVDFLLVTQSADAQDENGKSLGGPLLVEKSEIQPARTKVDEAGLEVTFVAARLNP